jgi:hypothetical protein
LGYDISVSRDRSIKRAKNGRLQRAWSGRVKLTMPHEKWFDKLIECKSLKIKKNENGKERWKTIHRGNLTNRPEIEIISKYNAEIRGIYNYYRMTQNVSTLDKFANIMKGSMYKTFASKYRTTVSKIKKAHDKNGVFGVDYQTKDGTKRCEIYNNGFKQQKEVMPANADILPQYRKYDRPNSLARRLKLGICELCGNKTDEIVMHHVRQLKDIGNILPSELLMMEKHRKSLALCPACFKQTQAELL